MVQILYSLFGAASSWSKIELAAFGCFSKLFVQPVLNLQLICKFHYLVWFKIGPINMLICSSLMISLLFLSLPSKIFISADNQDHQWLARIKKNWYQLFLRNHPYFFCLFFSTCLWFFYYMCVSQIPAEYVMIAP